MSEKQEKIEKLKKNIAYLKFEIKNKEMLLNNLLNILEENNDIE